MSNIKKVFVIGNCPIKDGAALHGADIGYVFINNPPVELTVDMDLEHDRWVPITDPNPWPGKDNINHKQGWVKMSCIAVMDTAEQRFLLIIKSDGSATIQRIV